MDLGTTLAVFVMVALVLMLSFCLLLKYYAHKLKSARREAVTLSALDDKFEISNEQLIDGAYEQFCERRRSHKQNQMKHMSFDQDKLIQNTNLRQVLDISNNIYGITKLRKQLNNQIPPLSSETNRNKPSIKSFHISRLDTMESQKQRIFYPYIQKLVKYSEEGLMIIEAHAISIKKKEQTYKLIQNIEEYIQEPGQHFCDKLEIYGFYPNGFGNYKFVNSVDVTDVKENEVLMKSLKTVCNKQAITEQEFYKYRQEMYEQIS